jgi:hypothetical protein
MRREAKRTLTVITLLVALFFSQLWVAAYACTTTPALSSSSSTEAVTFFDGHTDLRDHQVAAVCQAHCDNSAQPDHAQQPARLDTFDLGCIDDPCIGDPTTFADTA